MKKFDWLALLLIVILALIGVKALFHPGFYTSHDGEHQVIRLIHFVKGLKDGQLPVRWAGPPAFNGYGYPLFIFTYRFPFYIGSIFYFLGLSFIDSIKAVFIFTYILSGLVMYLAQKKIWRNSLAALIGAIFYLWAPWRFSTILVRASLGEAVAFVFLPLVIWAVIDKRLLLGAFSLACLFLSHGMLTFLFLPFLLALIIFFLYRSKNKKSLIIDYWLLIILALATSAFYWLPALIEKKETVFAHILTGFYKQHFPTLKQLIYSSWGYGLSHPGTELDAMSFQVGLAQWLVVFLAVLVWWRQRQRQRLLGLLIIFFLSAIFLMLPFSAIFWQMVGRWLPIDFPFRYLALTTLFSSLIAGGLIISFKKKIFLYPMILILLTLVFYGNRNHLRVNQYTDFNDAYYENHFSSSSSFDEYRPLSIIAGKFLPQTRERSMVKEGEADIQTIEIRSNFQKFQIKAKKESRIQFNTIYYPGWQLWVSGHKRNIDIASLSGLIQFSLEKGDYEVMLKFSKTKDRIIGEAISLIFLLFVGYRLIKCQKESCF